MKKTLLILIAALVSLPAIAQDRALKPVSSNQLEGTWYGLYMGSQASVTFNIDNTFAISNEAFSQMNMAGAYVLDGNSLSLGGIPGMEGKGLVSVEGDKMYLLVVFGAQGMVKAPVSFNDGIGNPAAMQLRLSRDKKVIDQATTRIDAPASAALAFERNRRLGKGLNLNSVFDGIRDGQPLKQGSIRDIASQGFDSVRIPIRWGTHTLLSAPYTIDPDFLKRVDGIVNECLANGLAVILDNHYYPVISFGFASQDLSYEENIDRLYSIWEQLSKHYKDYPDGEIYFGIMNEPSLQLEPSRWNEIVAECVKRIRKDNPGKTIMIATPSLGQHWTIGLLEFPADEWNLIVDAHYYLPQTFTHQGISFAMAEGSLGTTWTGSAIEKAPIAQDLDYLADWSQRNARPVNIGEFGVCDNADEASRKAYLDYVSREIYNRGFSFHLWAYFRDTFGIYDEDSGKWNQGILNALDLQKDDFQSSFKNPPLSYAPFVRWWWPGNDVETGELIREIDLFARHHIGGVEIQPFALVVPPPMERMAQIMSFDTDGYYSHLKTVMEAARWNGLTVDLTNGSGWPASGSHISEAEENRSLQYGMAVIPAVGGTLEIPRSERQDSKFAELVGLLEAEVSEPAADGSRKIQKVKKVDGATFAPGKAAAGFQRVLIALWNVPSQETNMIVAKADAGNVLDHFDTNVLRKNYDHYFGTATGLDAYYGKPFRAFFNDSYEFKVDRHITSDFREVFLSHRGYDPLPWMPANIWYGYNNMYDNGHAAPEFRFGDEDWRLRYDYDLTVSDLVRNRLLKGSSSWAHEHGLLHRTQAYGLPMDYMGAAGDADIPETENMIFGGGSEGGLKMVSSGAMLYNRPLVSAESGVHINRALMVTPQKLRSIADKLLSSGINQIIWHGSPYKYEVAGNPWQPFYNSMIGVNFSSDLSEENVFWDELAAVNQYVQRAQYLMRSGKAEADILVYYPFLEYSSSVQNPEEILYYGMLPETEPGADNAQKTPEDAVGKWLSEIWPVLNELESRGLTWSWVNDESLQEMTATPDGRLHIRGNSYGGLVLFNLPWIQMQTAGNLQRQSNANILIIGDLPVKQPSFKDYAKNDRKTAALMKKVAAGKHVCKSAHDWTVQTPLTTLAGGERVRTARRRLSDNELVQLYWSVDNRWKEIDIQAGSAPYAYWLNAEDGSVTTVDRTSSGVIKGTLPPLSTRFLYLTDTPIPEAQTPTPAAAPKSSIELEKWTLQLGERVVRDTRLDDWRNIPELADSCGESVYTTRFSLEKTATRYCLDLGDVYYTAEVCINGKTVGKRIWKPFRFDITDYVQSGENILEIRVKASDYNAKVLRGREGDATFSSIAKSGRMANGLKGPVQIFTE